VKSVIVIVKSVTVVSAVLNNVVVNNYSI